MKTGSINIYIYRYSSRVWHGQYYYVKSSVKCAVCSVKCELQHNESAVKSSHRCTSSSSLNMFQTPVQTSQKSKAKTRHSFAESNQFLNAKAIDGQLLEHLGFWQIACPTANSNVLF